MMAKAKKKKNIPLFTFTQVDFVERITNANY